MVPGTRVGCGRIRSKVLLGDSIAIQAAPLAVPLAVPGIALARTNVLRKGLLFLGYMSGRTDPCKLKGKVVQTNRQLRQMAW